MKRLMWAVSTVVALGAGTGIVGAADLIAEKEVRPTLSERFTEATVKGTLMKMDREYYSIKETTGREIRLYVDASSKLDRVTVGDKVKAYVDEGGISESASLLVAAGCPTVQEHL